MWAVKRRFAMVQTVAKTRNETKASLVRSPATSTVSLPRSLVCDGPIFRKRIEVTKYEKMVKDGFWKHWFLDIRGYDVVNKA